MFYCMHKKINKTLLHKKSLIEWLQKRKGSHLQRYMQTYSLWPSSKILKGLETAMLCRRGSETHITAVTRSKSSVIFLDVCCVVKSLRIEEQ